MSVGPFLFPPGINWDRTDSESVQIEQMVAYTVHNTDILWAQVLCTGKQQAGVE